jgi:DNA repair exonuclease SbcCD ATPase subunit
MKFQQLQNSNKFFNDNTTCPTCSQEINDDFRVEKINSIVEKTNLVDLAISDIQGKLDKIINDLNIINDIINENNNIDKKIDILNSQINERNRQRKALKEQIEAKKDIDTNRIQNELDNLRVMEDEYSNVLDKKNELLEVYEYYELVSSLLKDSGIKQTIIRKYIPLINNLVNDYLSKLGFYVRFHLDEDFNETIYARGIEELSYANFSEGEKQRIDIAILLAWRDIAKMQNEMNTNLLFFDEILDGSADSEGAEYIVDLLTTMENTNVFVISHSVDKWLDKCRSVINISRENGYSVITSG